MQFAEPFDTFYKEVIREQTQAAGFEVIRMDEKPAESFFRICRERFNKLKL